MFLQEHIVMTEWVDGIVMTGNSKKTKRRAFTATMNSSSSSGTPSSKNWRTRAIILSLRSVVSSV
jgi:hypothetical protein